MSVHTLRHTRGLGGYFQLFPALKLGVSLTPRPHYPPPTGERVSVTFWVPEHLRRNILFLAVFEPQLRCPRCTLSSRQAQHDLPQYKSNVLPWKRRQKTQHKSCGISGYGNLIFDHLQHKQYWEPPSKILGYEGFPCYLWRGLCVFRTQ